MKENQYNLTKQQIRLHNYLKKHKGNRTTPQIIKYMGYTGKYADKYLYLQLHNLEDKGAITTELVHHRKIIVNWLYPQLSRKKGLH